MLAFLERRMIEMISNACPDVIVSTLCFLLT